MPATIPGTSVKATPSPSKKKYDVYIPYSYEDYQWVNDELKPRLKKARITAHYDKETHESQDKWEKYLNENLDNFCSILPIFSEAFFRDSLGKGWKRLKLVELANLEMHELIPVFVGKISKDEIPERFIGNTFYSPIDFTDYEKLDSESQKLLWDKVIKAIRHARNASIHKKGTEADSAKKSTAKPLNSTPSSADHLLTESGDQLVTESGNPIIVEKARDRKLGELDNMTLGHLDNLTLGQLDKQTTNNANGSLLDETGEPLLGESGEPILAESSEEPGKEVQSVTSTDSNALPTKQQEFVNVAGMALSDTYSLDDLLGYQDYVEALANFIESPKTKKPITIGIDAAWGEGKTTLMHLLEERLAPKEPKPAPKPEKNKKRWPWEKKTESVTPKSEHIYTVWFNAWQYDQQETLWAALVLEILAHVRKQSNWQQRVRLFFQLNYSRFKWGVLGWDIVKFILIVLTLIAAGYLGFSVLASYLGKNWIDTFEWLKDWIKVFATVGLTSLAYAIFRDTAGLVVSPFSLGISRYMKEPDYKNKVGFISQFQEDFKCIIESVTQKGKWPLVVFIDDLDRCSAPKAAEVVEAINLSLDSEYCVFIIGMDSAMLSRSVQAKYKDIQPFFDDIDYPSRIGLGRHFLEKIVQIDFRLPRPDPVHMSDFILAQLGRKIESHSASLEKQTAESLMLAEQRIGKTIEEARIVIEVNTPNLTASSLDDAEHAIMERTFEETIEVEKAINEMAPYLNYNPRRIKRFINIYRLQALIAYQRELLGTTISFDNLARWAVIGIRWPEFINFVNQDSRIIASLWTDMGMISEEKNPEQKNRLIETIKTSGKYVPAIQNLLSDIDFQKIILEIRGQVGEAQNYVNLALLFVVDHK